MVHKVRDPEFIKKLFTDVTPKPCSELTKHTGPHCDFCKGPKTKVSESIHWMCMECVK